MDSHLYGNWLQIDLRAISTFNPFAFVRLSTLGMDERRRWNAQGMCTQPLWTFMHQNRTNKIPYSKKTSNLYYCQLRAFYLKCLKIKVFGFKLIQDEFYYFW